MERESKMPALMLALVLMLTIFTGRAIAADEEDNFPDWIFDCPGHSNVNIWGNSTSIFTIRGAWPPFYLAWIKEKSRS
jgi:hypothetical protein